MADPASADPLQSAWCDAPKSFDKNKKVGDPVAPCASTAAPPRPPNLPDKTKSPPIADTLDTIEKSPTLASNLSKLQKSGWVIRYGDAGKGTYADRNKKEIVIDSNQKGNPNSVVQSLAHESGHALYTPDPYAHMKHRTRAQYIQQNTDRNLKDEGEATLMNIQVRKELKANCGPDIGIAGMQGKKYQEIADKYPDPKDRDKAREEIGQAYAKGESPSGSQNAGKNYEQYYSQQYADQYDDAHKWYHLWGLL